MKKMKTQGMGDDELQNLFEESFQETVASKNDIIDFEVKTDWDVNSDILRFDVTIIGLAGTPSIDAFKKGEVENADEVVIERADKGRMTLKLKPKETTFLSGNDYIIVYSNE